MRWMHSVMEGKCAMSSWAGILKPHELKAGDRKFERTFSTRKFLRQHAWPPAGGMLVLRALLMSTTWCPMGST